MSTYCEKTNTLHLAFSKNGKLGYSKPIVTMGVCVKDCEAYVREAINSILDQDFPHELMEVIVVDDGSEDRTLSVLLDTVLRMDMPVRVFHSEWRGLGPARNVVVNNARGKYIVWVDGDMILPKDHVRKQVEFMEGNPKVGIAKAKYAMYYDRSVVATLENIKFVVEDAFASKLPGTGGSICRVKAIREVGGFDDRLTGTGEDQDAAFRVRATGWLLDRTDAVFIEKRDRTWRALWDKYFWYGYGDYQLYRKNRSVFTLTRMSPPAGFVVGLIYSVMAYRLTHLRIVFLLPFHFAFKITAWCFGFARSQLDSFFRARTQNIKKRTDKLAKKESHVADFIERKLSLTDPWYQLILKMMKSVINGFQGKRILEVGCGLGGFCIRVAGKGGNSIGLDVSSSAIRKAKDLAKQYKVQNQVDFVVGDAQFLPFKDQSNELVICSETLEHVANYEQAFRELVRVTEKSGYLCVTVPNLLSTMFFGYIVLLCIGQPQYAKKFLYVEKEHIFHFFKVKKLFSRENLKVMEIRSTDFLYLPPTIRKALKIENHLKAISDRIEGFLENHRLPLRLFGANIGVIARRD